MFAISSSVPLSGRHPSDIVRSALTMAKRAALANSRAYGRDAISSARLCSLRHVPHSLAISSPVPLFACAYDFRMHRLVDDESAVILSKCLWGIAIYFRVCAKPIPGYIRASGHSGPDPGRRALLKLPKLRGARRPTEPHRL